MAPRAFLGGKDILALLKTGFGKGFVKKKKKKNEVKQPLKFCRTQIKIIIKK